MINVLYEDNHIIVVEKKINVPVCEDESHDLDLLTMIKFVGNLILLHLFH